MVTVGKRNANVGCGCNGNAKRDTLDKRRRGKEKFVHGRMPKVNSSIREFIRVWKFHVDYGNKESRLERWGVLFHSLNQSQIRIDCALCIMLCFTFPFSLFSFFLVNFHSSNDFRELTKVTFTTSWSKKRDNDACSIHGNSCNKANYLTRVDVLY